LEIDPDLLIPDRSNSLINGAIKDTSWDGPKEDGGYYWQMLEAVARHYHIDLEVPVESIPDKKLEKILYGTGDQELEVEFTGRNGRKSSFRATFEGVVNNLERRYRETNSDYVKAKIAEFMNNRPCQTCDGYRLRKEALAVTIEPDPPALCRVAFQRGSSTHPPGNPDWLPTDGRPVCAGRAIHRSAPTG